MKSLALSFSHNSNNNNGHGNINTNNNHQLQSSRPATGSDSRSVCLPSFDRQRKLLVEQRAHVLKTLTTASDADGLSGLQGFVPSAYFAVAVH